MGAGVSTHPFKPFKANGDVPIIGQPFTILSGSPTALIRCGCEAKSPILLTATQPGVCVACKKVFVIQDFAYTGSTGQVQVSLRLGHMADAPPEPVGATS